MPYVALQGLLDEPNAWGSYGYDKGAYLADLTDDVIDVLTAYVPKKSSPLSVLVFIGWTAPTPRSPDPCAGG